MRFQKYINLVLNKFNLLTDIPVQAFGYDGHRIGKVGLKESMLKIFELEYIYNKIERDKQNINTTITSTDNIHFTAVSICPKNKYRGLFIIGPYTSNKSIKDIVYKPLELKDYMISTLRTIWRDFPQDHQMDQNDNPYSFHIKKALDYIDSRYVDDIKLDDISEYLDINKSYFCSIFKSETGYTFTQYLNKVRIEKSKELLINKNYSMLDIALSVGFNNQNYYNIMFKRLTNTTPLEYRNKNAS